MPREPGRFNFFISGGDVYNYPASQLSISYVPNDATEYSAPPRLNSSLPPGCKGNPILGEIYSLEIDFDKELPIKNPDGSAASMDSINLISLKTDALESKSETYKWETQLSFEKEFTKARNSFHTCEDTRSGMTACYIPTDDFDKDKWNRIYQDTTGLHPLPFGRPFTVECLGVLAGYKDCNVTYQLTELTRINYIFSLSRFPIEKIFEFDAFLRNKLKPAISN